MQAQIFLCNCRGLLLKQVMFFPVSFFHPLKVPADDFVTMQLPLQGLCPCPLLLGNVVYVDPGGCCISVILFERIGLISLRSDPPFLYLRRGLKLCGLCKQTWVFISRKSEDAASLTTASHNLPFAESTMYVYKCSESLYTCVCPCTPSQHWYHKTSVAAPGKQSYPEHSQKKLLVPKKVFPSLVQLTWR